MCTNNCQDQLKGYWPRRPEEDVCMTLHTSSFWPQLYCRVQPPVTFPIGDNVNVLHDYKKTGPSTILKLLTCRCYHLIDTLIEFSQSFVLVTHLKYLNVPYPSIFSNFCMNYYAHVPCCEKIDKNPSTY